MKILSKSFLQYFGLAETSKHIEIKQELGLRKSDFNFEKKTNTETSFSILPGFFMGVSPTRGKAEAQRHNFDRY